MEYIGALMIIVFFIGMFIVIGIRSGWKFIIEMFCFVTISFAWILTAAYFIEGG